MLFPLHHRDMLLCSAARQQKRGNTLFVHVVFVILSCYYCCRFLLLLLLLLLFFFCSTFAVLFHSRINHTHMLFIIELEMIVIISVYFCIRNLFLFTVSFYSQVHVCMLVLINPSNIQNRRMYKWHCLKNSTNFTKYAQRLKYLAYCDKWFFKEVNILTATDRFLFFSIK